MKVKFTKLAVLLLAGAALFGCSTDYEVDIQKVDKKVDDLISGKVATLENQVAGLQATIATLESAADHAKDIQDLTNKINSTKDALQAQIDKINNETIPAINQKIADLQSGKLDKSEFNEYKEATAETIALINAAIQNLADTKLDKTEFDQKVAEIIAKFDDYVLTKDFEEFKKIAATKAELEQLKTDLEARLTEDEADIAKLKKGIEDAEKKIEALEKLAEQYTKKVDDIIAELAFAEGDLQGYIDDAAAKALEDAMAYTDEQIATLREEMEQMKNDLLGYIYDLYSQLYSALSRVESVNFVPTHDDLKMNINMSVMTAEVMGEDGEAETLGAFVGQPTKVTYKISPASVAQEIAEAYQYMIDPEDPALYGDADDVYTSQFYWQIYEIFFGYGAKVPVFWFDVKPLETRADDEADPTANPQLIITNLLDYNENGELTFEVLPVNIASFEFLSNALQPVKDVYMFDGTFDVNGYKISYPLFEDAEGDLWYTSAWDSFAHHVYKIDDLKAFDARNAFAASLNFYMPVASDNYLYELGAYWEEGYLETEPDIYAGDYMLFENGVASPYNVLYPVSQTVEILGEPYKPEYDQETGEPKVDEDGYAKLIPAMEEHQELPYSSLRENPVGEKASQDPKGYRIILNESVPAVVIDGGDPMTFEDAADKYGIILPDYSIAFKEFEYSNEDNAKEPLYIGTEKVYAEVEMNPEKTAAERKLAIGDVIKGTYTYSTDFGDFEGWGDVTITPALGEVAIDATIVWTYV